MQYQFDAPSNRLTGTMHKLAEYAPGDIPPQPRFRRFRKEANALRFAMRMMDEGRLFKVEEPVVAQKLDSKLMFFVNYRRKR